MTAAAGGVQELPVGDAEAVATAVGSSPTGVCLSRQFTLRHFPANLFSAVLQAVLHVDHAELQRLRGLSIWLARPSARIGGEVWLAEPFAVRAGVDRVGEGALAEARPSAGFAVRRRLNELGLRVDYTATLEPYGTGVLQMVLLPLLH